MPVALEVPWSRIAAEAGAGAPLEELSQTYGVAVGTLKARSAREGWKRNYRELAAKREGTPVARATNGMQPSATLVAPPLLERLNGKTKVAQAKAVYSGSRTMSKLKGEQIIANAGQLKSLVDAADKLHGWSKESAVSPISIYVGPAAPAAPTIDISVERL